MIRVLIVDDHPIVHDGVATALSRTTDIRLTGSAETVGDGLRLLAQHDVDVVLLDMRLDGADGLSAIDKL